MKSLSLLLLLLAITGLARNALADTGLRQERICSSFAILEESVASGIHIEGGDVISVR